MDKTHEMMSEKDGARRVERSGGKGRKKRGVQNEVKVSELLV